VTVLLVGVALPGAARAEAVVFAAASLKTALDEVAGLWETEAGKDVTISYAASSALAKQIEEGAPADLFLSADLDWMDELAGKGLIRDETRVNLFGNRIVLIAPADSELALAVGPGMDLAGALGDGRLAMANPDAVPAGKYGKAALQSLGVWESVADKVAAAENVRAALAFVSRGEALLGIVYQTDAAAEPGVKVVGAFAEETHPPIIYPAALTASSTNPDAESFLQFLRAENARAVFVRQGFIVLEN
jgi:molybdate transport system substrate-binding protein